MPLEKYAEQVLGGCEIVADHSWGHRGSSVIEVRDRSSASWFVKRHRDRARYLREVRAYRRWVPVLGIQAPALRAHDDKLSTLVLSAVPGESDWDSGLTPEMQHQAGVLLRRLHDSQPLPAVDVAGRNLGELDRLAARADGLLGNTEFDFARTLLRRLAGVGPLPQVPCHGDYTPRNWLIADGRLCVIDFEWARPDLWVNDLARLYLGPWWERPYLGEAFLDGYGRTIGSEERALLFACGAVTTIFHIIWAQRHGETEFENTSRQILSRLMSEHGGPRSI